MMSEKWKMYVLCFITYSSIHAYRTAWASLKPILNDQPYNFSHIELGVIDLIILFTLSIGVNLFGWLASKWNAKYFLIIGMIAIVIGECLQGLMLKMGVTDRYVYFLLNGIIGFVSCTGWPSCFYIISKYFQKQNGVALSIFNSTSQFGDFIALFISYQIAQSDNFENNDSSSYIIWSIALYTILLIFCNKIIVPTDISLSKKHIQIPTINQQAENNINTEVQTTTSTIDTANNINNANTINSQSQKNIKSFNCLTVWSLPNVLPIVLSYSMVKAINTVIVNWLVFYLSLKGLKKQGKIIVIAWSVGIFLGGIVGAKINSQLSQKKFAIALVLCGIIFFFIQQLDNPNPIIILILTAICGLLFGAPYNLMATAVPMMLSEQKQINQYEGIITAIISIMYGGGQLLGAMMMFIIPVIGIYHLHYCVSALCLTSALLLIFVARKQKNNRQYNVKENSNNDTI